MARVDADRSDCYSQISNHGKEQTMFEFDHQVPRDLHIPRLCRRADRWVFWGVVLCGLVGLWAAAS